MARKLRVQYPDALYHVMNRGLDRRVLFCDERDCRAFLEDLESSSETHAVVVHAYCLLPNHYHLLIRTPRANVSSFMQSLQTRYAVFYNHRHRKKGHVFEGPYRAVLVQEDDYLLRLSRYIHLNPVRTKGYAGKPFAEIVDALRQYRWSSYREYIGLAKRKPWMDYDLLENQVLSLLGRKRGAYRKFVESGLAESDRDLEGILREGNRLALGGAEFVEWVDERYRELSESGERCREDVSLKGAGRQISPDTVLQVLYKTLKIDDNDLMKRRGGGLYRGFAARLLVQYSGLTQREVAVRFGMGTGAAVSIRIKEAEQLLQADSRWRKKMDYVKQELEQ